MNKILGMFSILLITGCQGPGVVLTEGEASGVAEFFGVDVRTIKLTIKDNPPVTVAVKCAPDTQCDVTIKPSEAEDESSVD